MIEKFETFRRAAAAFCVSFSSRRLFFTCSPIVWGSKSVSFRISDLRQTRANGKKATRPCPCGYLGHFSNRCRCTPDQIARYRNKISGPLLDRIDLHIEVPSLTTEDLARASIGGSSSTIRARVEQADTIMRARQGKPNAQLEAAISSATARRT